MEPNTLRRDVYIVQMYWQNRSAVRRIDNIRRAVAEGNPFGAFNNVHTGQINTAGDVLLKVLVDQKQ